MPGFRGLLERVAAYYRTEQAAIRRQNEAMREALRAMAQPPAPDADHGPLPLDAAVNELARSFDDRHGGFGAAPKFPHPPNLDLLLRVADSPRPCTEPAALDEMVRLTLRRMAEGGICDQLAGGFCRYSVDERWLIPHFEKMLYDNAQLARVYVHAWQLTRDEHLLDVARTTLDYMAREMRTADGAFAASQDADSDGVEGATYVWRADELASVLAEAGLPEAGPPLSLAYGVAEGGNWEGVTILSRVRNDREVASVFGGSPDEMAALLGRGRAALLEARQRRPQPARDDKVLGAWNGLAIAAFADAARAMDAMATLVEDGVAEASARYRAIASEAAAAVLDGLRGPDGRLARSWKDGRRSGVGVLEDHACLAEGLLALYEATFDERWFTEAHRLASEILARFRDPAGGFFDTADDHDPLVARPRDIQDNAVPSGGSMAATVLLRLAALTGDGSLRDAAEEAIRGVTAGLADHPSAFAQWLVATDFALAPVVEVAVVADPRGDETRRLLLPALEGFRPHQVLAVGPDPAATAVPLLGGRFALDGRPTAFVCRNFACRQPVTEPEALATLLTEDWEQPGIILPA
jgi:uncharacterized protein YyaL (SSP411 family)